MIAGGFLGGDTQVYAFDLEGSQYFHLPWDTILLINGEIATVSQWGSGTRCQFTSGFSLAARTISVAFRSAKSVHRMKTASRGGQSMARTTFEWTFPIIEKARGALFYDMGFVNSSAWSFGFNHTASDIGIGLRLDLPIGPLASITDTR
jgi:Outer membrane protein/protective antigen OMA87